jgi:hypothetical protein
MRAISSVELDERSDGSGTITFAAAEGWPRRGKAGPATFVMIDDAANVYALIRQLRATARAGRDAALNEGAFPDRRWDLPAPEAEVLLQGPNTSDMSALVLALKQLVIRQDLALSTGLEPRRLRSPKRVDVLVECRPSHAVPEPSLRLIMTIYTVSPRLPEGVPVAKLARAIFEWREGYVKGEVLQDLEARGYYTREKRRWLGPIGMKRWVLTPAGLAARMELEASLSAGADRFGEWTVADELRARAGYPPAFGPLDSAFVAIEAGVREGWRDYERAHSGE